MNKQLHNQVLYGILFAFGQSVFFSILGLSVKLASETHHIVDVMFFRSFVCLLCVAAFLKYKGELHKIFQTNFKHQIIRGVLGTIGMVATFVAFSLLPLSEVQSLLFAAPLFVVALSYPALGEKVGPYRSAAAIIGFLGVLLIVQPSTISSFTGGLIGLGAAFMHAVIMLMLRFMGRSESPMVTIFHFSLISSLLMIPALPFFWTTPSPQTFTLLIVIGMLTFGVQTCLTKSYVLAPAAILAPITYLNLLWSLIFDFFIWGYIPGSMILIGAGIIVISNFTIILREARKGVVKDACKPN